MSDSSDVAATAATDKPMRDGLAMEEIPYLAELPTQQLHALVLIVVRGLTYTAASTELCCAEGTVKSQVSRARESLRNILTDEKHAPPDPSKLASWHKEDVLLERKWGHELEEGLAFLEAVKPGTFFQVSFEKKMSRAFVVGKSKSLPE